MLILKITDDNGRTKNGFQWPDSGPVECPDWNHEMPIMGVANESRIRVAE